MSVTSDDDDAAGEGLRLDDLPSKDDGPTEMTALRTNKLETLDDALPYVGDFGRYQGFLLFGLLPYSFGYASLYFSQFFLTIVPKEHWCKVDELVRRNLTLTDRIVASIPQFEEYPYYDNCHYKDLNYAELLDSGGPGVSYNSSTWQTNVTRYCEHWEYNFTEIPYRSIGAELDWVCDDSYLVTNSQAICFFGSIFGGIIFGWIADHKGRIPALTILCGFCFVASTATIFANSFWTFAAARFFTGLAFDNILNIPLIIVFEYITPERRTLIVNVAFGVFFALSSGLLPWCAYFLSDWRYLCILSSIPFFVGIFSPWILPESPRWYINHRKNEQVIEKLQRIASVNGKNPDREFYDTFYKNLNDSKSRIEEGNFFDLFRTPRLAKNTILLTLIWFLVLFTFDGHVYSIKLLESSVFVSFSIACITEFPAGLLVALVLDRWGRKFCAFISMAFITLFTIVEVMATSEILKLSMMMSNRFCLNMAANIGLQYATEVLPTPVRAQGVSMVHIFGIIGHACAPYVLESARYSENMPFIILTITSSITAALILLLPETAGRAMPQTLEEGENFGKDQNFWSIPCLEEKKRKKQRQNHELKDLPS